VLPDVLWPSGAPTFPSSWLVQHRNDFAHRAVRCACFSQRLPLSVAVLRRHYLPTPTLTAVRVRSVRIIRAYIHSATLYQISRGIPRGFRISACGTSMLFSTGILTESNHIYLSKLQTFCCANGSRLGIPRHQHKLLCNSATSYSFRCITNGVRNIIPWGKVYPSPTHNFTNLAPTCKPTNERSRARALVSCALLPPLTSPLPSSAHMATEQPKLLSNTTLPRGVRAMTHQTQNL
jgi:hypothetical protein